MYLLLILIIKIPNNTISSLILSMLSLKRFMPPWHIFIAKVMEMRSLRKVERDIYLYMDVILFVRKLIIHCMFDIFCAKGRQCIPDVNNVFFEARDPYSETYKKYCQNMKDLCNNPCKFKSTEADDDNTPTGK